MFTRPTADIAQRAEAPSQITLSVGAPRAYVDPAEPPAAVMFEQGPPPLTPILMPFPPQYFYVPTVQSEEMQPPTQEDT